MIDPQVTIVVSPRERFSLARESLESIYAHTEISFKLVYVDGGSPSEVRRYLEAQAHKQGFHLIRTNHYLSPNHARNLGLAQVDTQYVVFIDNDVIVTPGWLKPLVQCAEERGATVVSPVICQGTPVHEEIHCAGGEAHIWLDIKGENVRRRAREKIHSQGRRVADLRDQLKQEQTELAEFHCMLVRRSIFEQIGPLDEAIMNTREHVDFCITVTQAGGTVYLEPVSVVTYVPGPPLKWSDIPFYMLRWSDAWELTSLHRFRDKWDLTEDEFFKNRYKRLGWRRKQTIISPLVRQLAFGQKIRWLDKILSYTDKVLNRYLTNRFARNQPQCRQAQTVTESSTLESSRG